MRLRTAWGLQRAGGRIQAAVERAASLAAERGAILRDGPFMSLPGQEARVRDRTTVGSAGLRKPEILLPAELEAAVLHVVRTGLGASAEEIGGGVPRLLGFKAVSAALRQLVGKTVQEMATRGSIVQQGAVFVVAP